MALPGLVIAVSSIGDTLLYAVLPLYHDQFGVSLAMVGVLLSLNRWIRLIANSGVAAIGEKIGPHALMVAAAVGAAVSTTIYGLIEDAAAQIAARILWGISYAALNLATLAYAVSDRVNAGKRVGASRAAIGLVQAVSLVGGAWLTLEVGPRSVFVIFGALTLVSLGSALLLPRLAPEPVTSRRFRLPIPHRLETWGFVMGFTGDGVFLLTLAFLMKDSIASVAPVLATALLLALRWLIESIHLEDGYIVFRYRDRKTIAQLAASSKGRLRVVDDRSAYLPIRKDLTNPDSILAVIKALLRSA